MHNLWKFNFWDSKFIILFFVFKVKIRLSCVSSSFFSYIFLEICLLSIMHDNCLSSYDLKVYVVVCQLFKVCFLMKLYETLVYSSIFLHNLFICDRKWLRAAVHLMYLRVLNRRWRLYSLRDVTRRRDVNQQCDVK